MCDTCGCNVTHGNAHLLRPGGRLEKTADGRHLLKMAGCEESPQVSRRNLPSIRKLIRDLT